MDSELYAHWFNDSGLVVRMKFATNTEGVLTKTIQDSFGAALYASYVAAHRELSEDEARSFKLAITDPSRHADRMYEHLSITPEEDAMMRASAEQNERNRMELEHTLGQLAAARARAWEEAHRIVIY